MRLITRKLLNHPATRGRRLAALLRFLHWQTRSRTSGRDLIYPFTDGAQLIARSGWPVSVAPYYFGLDEFESMAFLAHVLRPGDLFVDVGAHIGTYSIMLAQRGVLVESFEPVQATLEFLHAMRRLNSLQDKIQIHPSAVGAQESTAMLTTLFGQQNHLHSDHSESSLHAEAQQAPMVTLDEALSRTPAALKIDVEGYELEVLKGASQKLADDQLRVVCVETMELGLRYGASDQEVVSTLHGYDFEEVGYQPRLRQLTYPEISKGMRIFVRDRAHVEERLRTADPIHYHRTVV